jgi:hypothetical protein
MPLEVFFIVSNAKSLLVSVIILVGHKRKEGCGDLKYSMLGCTWFFTLQLNWMGMKWTGQTLGLVVNQFKRNQFSPIFSPLLDKRDWRQFALLKYLYKNLSTWLFILFLLWMLRMFQCKYCTFSYHIQNDFCNKLSSLHNLVHYVPLNFH